MGSRNPSNKPYFFPSLIVGLLFLSFAWAQLGTTPPSVPPMTQPAASAPPPTPTSSGNVAKARPSCLGPEDCKEHPDYVPFSTAGSATTGTQAQPLASALPQPAPPSSEEDSRDAKLATNEDSVRYCDEQIREGVAREKADKRNRNMPADFISNAMEMWRKLCLSAEQEMYEKVRYTLRVVPRSIADACFDAAAKIKQSPPYETLSKCLDYELTRLDHLPSGSATLSINSVGVAAFWTFQECQKHQKRSGGVCTIR
jgi:hypothetical protein